MFDFLRNLFGAATVGRVEAAADRVGIAAERIAAAWEAAAQHVEELAAVPLPADGNGATALPRPARRIKAS